MVTSMECLRENCGIFGKRGMYPRSRMMSVERSDASLPLSSLRNSAENAEKDRLGANNYSRDSGWRLRSFSPAAFLAAYFFIQASQDFPAAVSRPVKARDAMSAYEIEIFSFESFGYRRTWESLRVAAERRSKR